MPTNRQVIRRLLFLGCAYVAAMIATLPFPLHEEGWFYLYFYRASYFWAFPAGLWFFFGHNADITEIIIAYCVYMALAVAAAVCVRRWILLVCYGVICALLILNVGGCRKVWTGVEQEFKSANPDTTK